MFKSPGFTLMELTITLAILMIMFAIAVPLFHQFMASVELKNTLDYSQFIYKKPNTTQFYDIRMSYFAQVLTSCCVIVIGIQAL